MKVVREALVIAGRTGVFVWNDYLNHLGATAALVVEDLDAAEEFLGQLAESAQRGAAYAAAGTHFYASWMATVRGDAARALHLLRLNSNVSETLGYGFVPFTLFARAQIEWQLGRRREAKESLGEARQSAQETESHLVLHACDLLESDFAWEDDREHALVCLRRGFAVARERGYFNMIWFLRSTMARVAVRAFEHGIEMEHVRAYVVKHHLFPDHVPPRVEAWPWQYRLRVLGSFELTQDNPQVAPPNAAGETRHRGLRGMPLRLLRAILAFGARGVRESQLIDALWPDAEGDAARRVFDTTLHRLRRQLGADQVLRLSDGRVFLDSRSCWIDIWALEDIITEVEREVSARGRLSILEDLAGRLISVYRGPLLGDGADDGWALGPRERIAGKFLRAAEPLGRALENGGAFGEAAALYRRVLEGHPLVEPFCAAQMRCVLAAGCAAEAARIFEEYRARLVASRQAEPGSEIAGLYAQARVAARGRVRPR
jgi:DNA-binding SARP family transcriptional activator